MKNDTNTPAGQEEQNDYSMDAVTAEKQLKKAQSRNTMIILLILVFSIVAYSYQTWTAKTNIDYIDGNVLKLVRSGSASVGNPWKNASFVGQTAFRSVFLTDATFTDVEPELAESYTVSDDGLTYVIKMKDGLKWSDGETLDVDDFVFSLEAFSMCESVNTTVATAFNKISGTADYVAGEADSISGLSKEGNTLTITLDMPHNTFALVLTQFVLLPEHILKDEDPTQFTSGIEFFTNPVTSGMYTYDTINADGDLELVLNPYYEAEASEIERIILYGDHVNMHIDHYSTTNLTEMVSYRNMPGFVEYGVNVYFYRYFLFNMMADYDLPEMVPLVDETGVPMLDSDDNIIMVESTEANEYPEDRDENVAMQDEKVRQAIAHAIDMESLLNDVYFGQGQLTYAGAIELSSQVYEYSPEKAKQLLAESGYDMDRSFTIGYYHSDGNTLVFLERVKEYLEEIGLTVRLNKTGGNAALYGLREYDMLLKALSAFNVDDWYSEYLSTNTNLNACFGTDLFDGLVNQLSATGDDKEAYRSTLGELVALEQELMYKIPLLSLNDSVYINSNRVSVPEDMEFGNTRYRSDLRLDEWYIKKA